MWSSAQETLGRTPAANAGGHKHPGSYAWPAHMSLARTPGPQARRRPCSPVGNGPVLLHREPGNGYSRALDRRRQGYCSHRHASILLPSKGREHVVRLERGLSAFLVKSSSQTFYSVKTCQELGMLPGSQRCPEVRGSSLGRGTIVSRVCTTPAKAITSTR